MDQFGKLPLYQFRSNPNFVVSGIDSERSFSFQFQGSIPGTQTELGRLGVSSMICS